MKLKKTVVALCTLGLISGFGSAQAAGLILTDWQIDLGSIGAVVGGDDFSGFGVYGKTAGGDVGLDELSFDALFHAKVTKKNSPLPFNALGDINTVDTLGQVTNGKSGAGTVNRTTSNKFLNGDFELTFVSTTSQLTTSNPDPVTGAQTNRHLGAGTGPASLAVGPDGITPTNGYLNIFADVISGAGDLVGQPSNTSQFTGGAGLDDGLLIAVFKVLPSATNSGSFNNSPNALDGQDDATFELVWQYVAASNGKGVLQDTLGDSLPLIFTQLQTDSNIDADPDGNRIIDTAPAGFPIGPLGGCPSSGDPLNVCGTENGSMVLQAVPEPGTLSLLGASLLGIAGLRRRRK